MNKLFISIALLLCTIISFAQKQTQLVGTWKLISGKMINGDSTYNFDNKSLDAIKIVTPTHFAVIAQNTMDSTFQHTNAGTVQMDDKNYTEQITYSSLKNLLQTTSKFTYHIEGDKWYIKGIVAKMSFEEEWQRVK